MWTDDLFGQLGHVLGEDFDPGEGSNLDAVTLEAYEYFAGLRAWPIDFFANVQADQRRGGSVYDPFDPFRGTGFCSADNVCH